MTIDKPHLACYKDVKLTKSEGVSWNAFSCMDRTGHEKEFEVAPRIIREGQP